MRRPTTVSSAPYHTSSLFAMCNPLCVFISVCWAVNQLWNFFLFVRKTESLPGSKVTEGAIRTVSVNPSVLFVPVSVGQTSAPVIVFLNTTTTTSRHLRKCFEDYFKLSYFQGGGSFFFSGPLGSPLSVNYLVLIVPEGGKHPLPHLTNLPFNQIYPQFPLNASFRSLHW